MVAEAMQPLTVDAPQSRDSLDRFRSLIFCFWWGKGKLHLRSTVVQSQGDCCCTVLQAGVALSDVLQLSGASLPQRCSCLSSQGQTEGLSYILQVWVWDKQRSDQICSFNPFIWTGSGQKPPSTVLSDSMILGSLSYYCLQTEACFCSPERPHHKAKWGRVGWEEIA